MYHGSLPNNKYVTTRSIMEYEVITLDTTILKAEWLRDLLIDIAFITSPLPPISIHCEYGRGKQGSGFDT